MKEVLVLPGGIAFHILREYLTKSEKEPHYYVALLQTFSRFYAYEFLGIGKKAADNNGAEYVLPLYFNLFSTFVGRMTRRHFFRRN